MFGGRKDRFTHLMLEGILKKWKLAACRIAIFTCKPRVDIPTMPKKHIEKDFRFYQVINNSSTHRGGMVPRCSRRRRKTGNIFGSYFGYGILSQHNRIMKIWEHTKIKNEIPVVLRYTWAEMTKRPFSFGDRIREETASGVGAFFMWSANDEKVSESEEEDQIHGVPDLTVAAGLATAVKVLGGEKRPS